MVGAQCEQGMAQIDRRTEAREGSSSTPSHSKARRIHGLLRYQNHLGGAQHGAVPIDLVANALEQRVFLELNDGRWIAIQIQDDQGQVNTGHVVHAPAWAR